MLNFYNKKHEARSLFCVAKFFLLPIALFILFLSVPLAAQNLATSTVINSSPNPSCFGTIASFTATVKSDGNPVNEGTVTFTEGVTILANNVALNASGQAVFSTSSLTAGGHTITATYNGTSNFTTSNNSLTQTVDEAALVNAGPDQTICATDVIQFNATLSGLATGMVWQSNASYGSFITSDVLPNAQFVLNALGRAQTSITFSALTNDPFPSVCQGGMDAVEIFINPSATVNAGEDITICASSTSFPTLNGVIGGGATTATWSGGAGTFSPNGNTLNATYIPSASELSNATDVLLTLTTNDPSGLCSAVSDQLLYSIDEAAVVNAGPDQTICATDVIQFNATLSGLATGMVWQSNASYGSFITSDVLPNAQFVLNALGRAQTSITFSALTNDPFPSVCQGGMDAVEIFINPSATVNAGEDITICASSTSFPTLNGVIGGGATTATWSGGTGTFSPNGNTLNATYIPSASELSNATDILLTLTTNDPSGLCPAASDQLLYSIDEAAVVNAGPDQTVCATDVIQFNATLGGLATGMVWQLNASYGNFITSDVLPNAQYVLNALGQAQTSITFSALTNDPFPSVCKGGVDEVVIFITPAGSCGSACVAPVISSPTVTQPTCTLPTGKIIINATGSGTLEYSINGGADWFASNTFSDLAPGSYNISVRLKSSQTCSATYRSNPVVLNAATGCCTGVVVNVPTVTQPTCTLLTGKIVVNATGSGTLQYRLNSGSWQTSNTFSALTPGSYNISVRLKYNTSCVTNYSGNPVVLSAATGCAACTLTCPANITVNNKTGYCGAYVSYSVTKTGTCGTLTYSKASESFFPVGTTTVIVTSSTGATCSFTVTVLDKQKPDIVCPADIVVTAASNSCSKVVNFTVKATDNCPGVVTVTTVPASGSTFPAGITTVTATAKDAAGNQSFSTFTVKVKESQPPLIKTVATPIVLIWPANGSYQTINVSQCVKSVTDNCSSIPVSSVKITKVTSDEAENASGDADGNTTKDIKISSDCKSVDLRRERKSNGNGRVYTIYLSVSDASGNTGTASFKIIAPITQTGTTAVTDAAAYTVNSNCSGNNYHYRPGDVTTTEEVIVKNESPEGFIMEQNYPNPFSGVTIIRYALPSEAQVSLGVYNQLGQRVAQLTEGRMSAGYHLARFDATKLAAGIYLYRLLAVDADGKPVVLTKKMIVAK